MRHLIINIAFFCTFPNHVWAQGNLIPNGDFEFLNSCPTYENLLYELNKAIPWYNPTSNTPDCFNVCDSLVASEVGEGIPYNWVGFQYPRSGSGCAGFSPYNSSVNGREYVSTRFSHQLDSGKKYCLTYYVCLTNQRTAAIGFLGAYFSADSIRGDTTLQVLNLIPQIQHPADSFLTDTLNWMKVTDTLIAQGNERYVTIGNFNIDEDPPIDTIVYSYLGWYWTYYYIDDVSLYEIDTNDSGIPPPVNTLQLIIPNLVSASVTSNWQFINLQQGTTVTIYNLLDQLLFQSFDYRNDFRIIDVAAGPYFYVVRQPNGVQLKGKLIIMR